MWEINKKYSLLKAKVGIGNKLISDWFEIITMLLVIRQNAVIYYCALVASWAYGNPQKNPKRWDGLGAIFNNQMVSLIIFQPVLPPGLVSV